MGNLEDLKKLLEADCKIDGGEQAGEWQRNAAHWAYLYRHSEVGKFIIEEFPDARSKEDALGFVPEEYESFEKNLILDQAIRRHFTERLYRTDTYYKYIVERKNAELPRESKSRLIHANDVVDMDECISCITAAEEKIDTIGILLRQPRGTIRKTRTAHYTPVFYKKIGNTEHFASFDSIALGSTPICLPKPKSENVERFFYSCVVPRANTEDAAKGAAEEGVELLLDMMQAEKDGFNFIEFFKKNITSVVELRENRIQTEVEKQNHAGSALRVDISGREHLSSERVFRLNEFPLFLYPMHVPRFDTVSDRIRKKPVDFSEGFPGKDDTSIMKKLVEVSSVYHYQDTKTDLSSEMMMALGVLGMENPADFKEFEQSLPLDEFNEVRQYAGSGPFPENGPLTFPHSLQQIGGKKFKAYMTEYKEKYEGDYMSSLAEVDETEIEKLAADSYSFR